MKAREIIFVGVICLFGQVNIHAQTEVPAANPDIVIFQGPVLRGPLPSPVVEVKSDRSVLRLKDNSVISFGRNVWARSCVESPDQKNAVLVLVSTDLPSGFGFWYVGLLWLHFKEDSVDVNYTLDANAIKSSKHRLAIEKILSINDNGAALLQVARIPNGGGRVARANELWDLNMQKEIK